MKQEEKINDPRISRIYFSFPAYIALVFLVAVLMMLPTVFYGGFHLILEKSGSYLKWYFVYCLLISLLISAALGVQKYIVIDRPIRRLSVAAREELVSANAAANAVCPKPHNIVKLRKILRSLRYCLFIPFPFFAY